MKKLLNFKTIGIALFCLFLLSRCGISALTYVHPAQAFGSFIPYITLMIGIFCLFMLSRETHKQKEYRFKNLTDGGVIKFDNYKDSVKFNRKTHLISVGYLFTVILIIGSILAIVMMKFASHYN